MGNLAGFTQMGSMPAAAGARAACGQPASYLAWQLVATGAIDLDAKSIPTTFVDAVPTHRHRRPWGTS